MKQSDTTARFATAFASQAEGGLVSYPLPDTKPASGRVSLLNGFPVECFTALSAGGIPPSGADFNGLFRTLSEAIRANEAGQIRPFNAEYAQKIGGYPKAALVSDPGKPERLLISTQDDNLTDATQETSGGAWVPLTEALSEALSAEITARQDGEAALQRNKVDRSGDTITGTLTVNGASFYKQQVNFNGYNINNSNAVSIGAENLPNGASCLIGGSVASNYSAYFLQLFKDSHNLFSIDNGGQIQTPAGAQFGGAVQLSSSPPGRQGSQKAVNANWVLDALPLNPYLKIITFTASSVTNGQFISFPSGFSGGNPVVTCTTDQGDTVIPVSISGAVASGFYVHSYTDIPISYLHIIAIGLK